jgi:hypothetical protein
MRHGLGLLVVLAVLASAATAQAAPRHSAAYWTDRAVEASNRVPACAAQPARDAGTTDAPAPPELLARYGILRSPATEPVPPLQGYDGGELAVNAARTRTVDGVQATVTPILNWRPYVRSAACDAAERHALGRLLRREPSAAVRAAARDREAQFIRTEKRIRKQAPRTLLYLAAPGLSPIGLNGGLELSRLRGLYLSTPGPTVHDRTLVGLIPDGVARIRYRAKGAPDVEVPVVDNIVVARLPGRRTLGQQVWLRADGSVVRTIGRLR